MSREPGGLDGVARAIALAVLLATVAARAQPVTGELSGVIVERGSERPLPGVSVTMSDAARVARTDDEGRFRFIGAPVGRHTLVLGAPDLDDITIDEEVVGGAHREVRYLVTPRAPQARYQSTVRAPRLERSGVVETGVAREEARRVPGTADDPLKVVENLPGVARATVGSGALIIWGAAPADSRVVVDGVEIPALYHVGGWRSTLNGDLVGRVSLSPGGFGAEWVARSAASSASRPRRHPSAACTARSPSTSSTPRRSSAPRSARASRSPWPRATAGSTVSPAPSSTATPPPSCRCRVGTTIRCAPRCGCARASSSH